MSSIRNQLADLAFDWKHVKDALQSSTLAICDNLRAAANYRTMQSGGQTVHPRINISIEYDGERYSAKITSRDVDIAFNNRRYAVSPTEQFAQHLLGNIEGWKRLEKVLSNMRYENEAIDCALYKSLAGHPFDETP